MLKDESTNTEVEKLDKSEWLIDLSDSDAPAEQPLNTTPVGKNAQMLSLLDMVVDEEPQSSRSALQPEESGAREEKDVKMIDVGEITFDELVTRLAHDARWILIDTEEGDGMMNFLVGLEGCRRWPAKVVIYVL